ncbi:MAG: septal ring lytic transglycosylase RlpA family protein [Alphaproteobacteria bacterium]|nr:septal ring lytic transglycosylase RlpA family protein [Alphaproteobacteria bacterium]
MILRDIKNFGTLIIVAFLMTGCMSHYKYQTNTHPYSIYGETYYPLKSARGFSETGIASWYGNKFHGRPTASGEKFNQNAMTAAHKTLPFGTRVRITNLQNNKTAIVTINDRGPFKSGRIIDVSRAAARKLGMIGTGTARVKIKALN